MGFLQLAFCVCILAAQQSYGHATVDSRLQGRIQQLLATIITPEYNANLRPYGVNGTDATSVGVFLRNVDIVEVDETNGRLTFQAFFRQQWIDPRLAFNDSDIRYIPIRDCKTIWIPDLYFETGLDSVLSSVGKPIRVLKVYPDGRVFYSIRLTQTLNCPSLLNLENKEISCQSGLLSYGYRSDDIQVTPLEGEGFNLVSKVTLRPRYSFDRLILNPTCDLATRRVVRDHELSPPAPISCLGLNFRLNRA